MRVKDGQLLAVYASFSKRRLHHLKSSIYKEWVKVNLLEYPQEKEKKNDGEFLVERRQGKAITYIHMWWGEGEGEDADPSI